MRKESEPLTIESLLAESIHNLAENTLITFAHARYSKSSTTPKLRKQLSQHTKNLQDIEKRITDLNNRVNGDSLQFNAQSMQELTKLHNSLEAVLTNDEVNQFLAQEIESEREESSFQRRLKFLDSIAPTIGVLGATQMALGLSYGSMFGALTGGATALLGLNKYLEKQQPNDNIAKPKIRNFIATMLPVVTLQVASSLVYKTLNEIPQPDIFAQVAQTYAMVCNSLGLIGMLGITIGYTQDFEYRHQQRQIELSHTKFNYFTKSGIATRFAYQNLSYIERVCNSEKRPLEDFADQVEYLKYATAAYLGGSAQVEDLLEAQIQYVPKSEQPKKRILPSIGQQPQSQKTKSGYTQAEYQTLQAKREVQRQAEKKKITDNPNQKSQPQSTRHTHYQTPKIQIAEQLANKSDQTLQRFTYQMLCDLTQEKISSSVEFNSQAGKFIPVHGRPLIALRANSWGINIQDKYGIDTTHTTVYKVQPAGAMRAIVGLTNDNQFIIYDILTHQQYDREFGK
jgi:hypothetical protein